MTARFFCVVLLAYAFVTEASSPKGGLTQQAALEAIKNHSAPQKIAAGEISDDESASENPFPGACGQTSVPQKVSSLRLANKATFQRIVGGSEANPRSIPFIVSLRKLDGLHFCGGALIRVDEEDESDIVVTAARCVAGEVDNPSFDVVAGAHYRSKQEEGEESVRALKVIVHQNYSNPVYTANDVAVIKLSEPVKFSKTIQPVCLPVQAERVKIGAKGIVAGWGLLKEGGIVADAEVLRQVVVPTVGYDKCKRTYHDNLIDDATVCAGFDQGQKGVCAGDTGGPYYFEGKSGYTLQGMVGWTYGCARAGRPATYTRVSTYVNWIQEQVRALNSRY